MLVLVPLELRDLNRLVSSLHRHHKPVQGHRFSIGVEQDGVLVGGCSVGRPVSYRYLPKQVIEVTRLVTNGTPNACSMLYSAAARAARAIGYKRIQTYVLEEEPGTSLKAAGWVFDGFVEAGSWYTASRTGARRDQPECRKQRWVKEFR